MKKYEGDKTVLCTYFHFMLGIRIPNAIDRTINSPQQFQKVS